MSTHNMRFDEEKTKFPLNYHEILTLFLLLMLTDLTASGTIGHWFRSYLVTE